jgi:hypothetical protein
MRTVVAGQAISVSGEWVGWCGVTLETPGLIWVLAGLRRHDGGWVIPNGCAAARSVNGWPGAGRQQGTLGAGRGSPAVGMSLAVIMGPFEPRFAMGMGPPVCQ